MCAYFRQRSDGAAAGDPARVIKVGRSNATAKGRSPFCDNSVVNSKYTVLNFVPRSLFEQFRRLANVYFLVMGGLMLLGTYSPVFKTPLGALTTLFPLSIVLVISMVQEGLGDLKRHRADDETNNRPACVTMFPAGQAEAVTSDGVPWKNIQVGDILRITDKQALPADVMLLYTSENEHIAYIETSQIDGETNLKLRRAIPFLPHENVSMEEGLSRVVKTQASIECEGPNTRINSFTGVCTPEQGVEQVAGASTVPVPIDIENVIMRGSVLRNTRWAYGVVVYTGRDTKIQRNSRSAPSKMSRIDDLVNRAIYVILLLDVILVTVSTVLLMDFETKFFAHLTYLGFKIDGVTPASAIARLPDGVDWQSHTTTFVSGWLTFVVLFNNFVPISMYVTLEVITYFHIYLINEDLDLYHTELDMPAKARSNNVTDLGQIEYVFSDKTGTLTENIMKFKRCSIEGKIYGAPVLETPGNRNQVYAGLETMPADATQSKALNTFLRILALCHTVVVEHVSPESQQRPGPTPSPGVAKGSEGSSGSGSNNKTKTPIIVAPRPRSGSGVGGGTNAGAAAAAGGAGGAGAALGIEYQAESPDEKALVEAAADFGYVLSGRTTQQINIVLAGKPRTYEPLAVNKFDSDRKRMSILLREPGSDSILLFCKGADTAMLGRAVFKDVQARETTVEHLKLFSEEGLRTLVLGCRELSAQEYHDWLQRYQKAALSDNRAVEMSRVADEIEKDLQVMGITAIEDKLQDGVPDTIANLSSAGIKVCVLTGDKMETAINIGYSCKVLREGMFLLQLTAGPPEAVERGLCQLYKTVTDKRPVVWAGERTLAERLGGRPSALQVSVMALLDKYYPAEGGGTMRGGDLEESRGFGATGGGGIGSQPLLTTGGGVAKVTPTTPTSTTSAMDSSTSGPLSTRTVRATWVPPSPSALFRALEVTLLSPSKHKRPPGGDHFAFIMEGPALVHVLGNPVLESMLFETMQSSVAVIACRVSPKQKAQLVRLVKCNVSPVPVTLAIGDGANDVGMIQEAHVGVGISGNEGQQAVNASDFAVAQFRFLQRLLLVHGRWNYRRMCKTVLYSFYKNLVLVMTLFLYLFHSGFAGTSLYEDNLLAGYNFFLGMQILTLGLFDKDVSARYAMQHPHMYASGRENMDLNSFQVIKWIITAVLHSFFVYFFGFWMSSSSTLDNQASYYVYGMTIYSILILLMNFKVLLEFKTITYPGKATRRKRRRPSSTLPTAAGGGEGEGGETGSFSLTSIYKGMGLASRGTAAKTHPEGPMTTVVMHETINGDKGSKACVAGWTVVFWAGSVVLFFFVSLVYNAMLTFAPEFFCVADMTWSEPLVWLQVMLIPCICVGIDIVVEGVQAQLMRPSAIRVGIEENRLLGVDDWE